MAIVDRVRDESGDKPEDAVRKLQWLKKALARARGVLSAEAAPQELASLAQRRREIADEIKVWDDCLEEIRCELADLIAERDRWKIAHDKLRERIDHHTLAPRSEADRQPQSTKMATPRRMSSDESQDFSAIDEELERLNASMLRAFSSE